MIDLLNILSNKEINEFYEYIQYDYSKEVEYTSSKKFGESRQNFIQLFKWHIQPDHENILRIFNQVNTYYTELFIKNNLDKEPSFILKKCNELFLFKQGKKLGLREGFISFGVRQNYDRQDPINSKQWLYGISPIYISEILIKWQAVVDKIKQTTESALFLTMVLICIHPFSDGNGRLGRIIFTWLLNRWKLKELFLAEESDGEFLRTGFNIESTEHIMGSYFLYLCDSFNEVPFLFRDFRSDDDFHKAFEKLASKLDLSTNNNSIIYNEDSFKKLLSHFWNNEHITEYSQRFKALKTIIDINLPITKIQ